MNPSQTGDIQNLHTFDPFADVAGCEDGVDGLVDNTVHVRVQQRNGRKCITHVQGLAEDLDFKKTLRRWKRGFNCNGSLQRDSDGKPILQMSGDQRQGVRDDLVREKICEPGEIVLH